MLVTEIVPLDRRRSKVTLDEDFTLALYQGELRKYKIVEGGELSDAAYQEIVKEILTKRAMERACYILKSSDKTELDLRRKLKDGYFPAEVIDHVMEILKRHRYIDDENYARRYVECHSTNKSRRQIGYDLKQKGVDAGYISQLLEDQPVDEDSQIRVFLKKRHIDLKKADINERRKAMAALGRKGFSYEAVSRVMGDLLKED